MLEGCQWSPLLIEVSSSHWVAPLISNQAFFFFFSDFQFPGGTLRVCVNFKLGVRPVCSQKSAKLKKKKPSLGKETMTQMYNNNFRLLIYSLK